MAVIRSGATTDELTIETTKAARVTARPLDPTTLGAYSISLVTGTMAAGLAAASEVVQFRWTDATRLAVITRVDFEGGGSITAFAAGFYRFELVIARSWTVDGTGGTAATITGNNNKLRTSFGTTLLGTARVATTAALGAGTKTLDTQGISSTAGGVAAAPAVMMFPEPIYEVQTVGHPIVLAQNEGLVVRATVPATGTWTASWTIKWTEVAAY